MLRREWMMCCGVALGLIVLETRLGAESSTAGTSAGTAVQALTEALHDEDDQIRIAAGNSLAQIGEPAIEEVIKVLSSDDQVARSLAAQVLGRLRAKSAVPELSRVIRDKSSTQHTRLNAILAVGNILADAESGTDGGLQSIPIHVPGGGGGF